jgi:hypothetical protein
VTIFCTVAGLVVIYGLVKLLRGVVFVVRARMGGWVVYGEGEGDAEGDGEVWVRRAEGWGMWWRRVRGRERENEGLVVDEGTRERAWWTWRNVGRKRGIAIGGEGERRALLR